MTATGRGKKAGLSPSAWIGIGLIALFLLTALVGPLVAPYSPTHQDLDQILAGPSAAHWLGTDENGVDVLSELLYGARLALIISGIVVAICATVGTGLGILAGYYRGWVDEVIMRTVDVLLAFPGILLNIAIVALIARPGVGVMIFALSLNGWVGYARLARGQVLSVREREYVQAARAIGAGPARIMWKHIFPNILSPILVQMSFAFGGVILVEASLSFLGLGPQVNYTWGALLDQGTTYLWQTQRLALVPGVAIMLVVLGSNLLGDGLRDRFDPKRQVVG
ncbi:MAG TPA: ABC transporter permease [Kofleriaceae bacterium]|nr:ABC transporter permease [Kofleriaceae bacterium]